MLDAEGTLKIVDFGLAARFEPGQLLFEYCGCPEYAAPEVLHEQPHQGPPLDVWALGVMLFDLVLGRLPFADAPGSFALPASLEHEASPELAALLHAALCEDPASRARPAELATAPWMELGRAGRMDMMSGELPPPQTPLGRRLCRECDATVFCDLAFSK